MLNNKLLPLSLYMHLSDSVLSLLCVCVHSTWDPWLCRLCVGLGASLSVSLSQNVFISATLLKSFLGLSWSSPCWAVEMLLVVAGKKVHVCFSDGTWQPPVACHHSPAQLLLNHKQDSSCVHVSVCACIRQPFCIKEFISALRISFVVMDCVCVCKWVNVKTFKQLFHFGKSLEMLLCLSTVSSCSAEADKEMFSQFDQTVEMIWKPLQATWAYQSNVENWIVCTVAERAETLRTVCCAQSVCLCKWMSHCGPVYITWCLSYTLMACKNALFQGNPACFYFSKTV